ncbi:signal recognition particle-docking protein FtsY [Thermosediminibacter oceani]|uniref:Signal recognition particle receptor FtsY n=1 Tax=Thermosediminibacter oceani (strain ATCC BAA-1034 / DSM 16646 / JW/IW-1228P) TaxID=555079 RepID=D9S348_THEOJ|nr:signal recognition particle-docking protein FtsY [Thermosediminibacter oceani]ADL07825.1 signal recognition particle-docking protein FtsY [Thermosediminibacter oceani DSM 16646]
MGFFERLKQSLAKTRNSLAEKVESLLKFSTKIDEETLEELEEILITADIGVDATEKLISRLREKVKAEKIKSPEELKEALKNEIIKVFPEPKFDIIPPSVILIVGVNGVGKTTTIGKLAFKFKSEGKKVILAAADTFRAAATEQLSIWGQRVGVDVIKHQEGSDPASVLFDAIQAGKARRADIIICDTAGRLHTRKNLMEELKKLYRVSEKEYPEARISSLLVLDATTGQNAIAQARIFKEAVNISGIILTKLDGTAKGGVAVAIASELNLPVLFVGVGEGVDDLQEFDPKAFVDAIF